MKYLKKFEGFLKEGAAEPATKPSPSTTPTPAVDPGTRPERRERPSPIRRESPAPGVEPDPKAQKKNLKKAKSQDVANRFIELATEEGFDFKKYFPNI